MKLKTSFISIKQFKLKNLIERIQTKLKKINKLKDCCKILKVQIRKQKKKEANQCQTRENQAKKKK